VNYDHEHLVPTAISFHLESESCWTTFGKKAGEPIDFFHDGVIHTAEIPLGVLELRNKLPLNNVPPGACPAKGNH
jgi:hypothetical protein